MIKHDKGPWRVVRVLLPGEQSDVPGVVSESGVCLSSHITMANAHLIAAAPEMLEALQMAHDRILAGCDSELVVRILVAAIVKAEGREL